MDDRQRAGFKDSEVVMRKCISKLKKTTKSKIYGRENRWKGMMMVTSVNSNCRQVNDNKNERQKMIVEFEKKKGIYKKNKI